MCEGDLLFLLSCMCFRQECVIPMHNAIIIMPPTLKKLMGHIAFGACVGGSHFWLRLYARRSCR